MTVLYQWCIINEQILFVGSTNLCTNQEVRLTSQQYDNAFTAAAFHEENTRGCIWRCLKHAYTYRFAVFDQEQQQCVCRRHQLDDEDHPMKPHIVWAVPLNMRGNVIGQMLDDVRCIMWI